MRHGDRATGKSVSSDGPTWNLSRTVGDLRQAEGQGEATQPTSLVPQCDRAGVRRSSADDSGTICSLPAADGLAVRDRVQVQGPVPAYWLGRCGKHTGFHRLSFRLAVHTLRRAPRLAINFSFGSGSSWLLALACLAGTTVVDTTVANAEWAFVGGEDRPPVGSVSGGGDPVLPAFGTVGTGVNPREMSPFASGEVKRSSPDAFLENIRPQWGPISESSNFSAQNPPGRSLLAPPTPISARRFRLPTAEQWEKMESIPLGLSAQWIGGSNGGLVTSSAGLKFPLLKFFGSPPPIVRGGFAHTALSASEFGLPNSLYEYSIGISTVRPLSDRWTLRTLIGVALATDHENQSSDAWQFRGGAFGVYRANETWQWTIGAIALGRSDLPAVPAIGVVWSPSEDVRWDLIPPNPRLNWRIQHDGRRQDWVYLGGGFNGTTWGVESLPYGDDRLTYRDLRLALGWQRTPMAERGVPFVRGRKYGVELAYAFNREFELERNEIDIALRDAWILTIESQY